MNHFQESHELLTSGIKKMFEDLERKYPELESRGELATLRSTVHKFCETKVPTNDKELSQLTQADTLVMMGMNTAATSLRRQKMQTR